MRSLQYILVLQICAAIASIPIRTTHAPPSTPLHNIKRNCSWSFLRDDLLGTSRTGAYSHLVDNEKKIKFLSQRIRDISIDMIHNQIVLNYLNMQIKDAISLQRELQLRRALIMREHTQHNTSDTANNTSFLKDIE